MISSGQTHPQSSQKSEKQANQQPQYITPYSSKPRQSDSSGAGKPGEKLGQNASRNPETVNRPLRTENDEQNSRLKG